MKRSRSVARFARRSGFGQPHTAPDSYRDSMQGSENPRKSLLGQPDQPNRPDSTQPIYEKHESPADEHSAIPPGHDSNRVSHVCVSFEADQADQPDRTRKSATFGEAAQPSVSLTEPDHWRELPPLPADDEHALWLRGKRPAAPVPWTDRPDVVTVVEDLADEGMRPGKIARTLGLRRGEVVTILRRTGR